MLQRIAEQSGGHFYYIEQPRQIADLLTSELGEALEVVARGATIALQLPEGVKAVPLTRFEWCPTDSGIRIALGDLVSRQELAVVIRLDVPALPSGSAAQVKVSMSDRDGALAVSPQQVEWAAADPAKAAGRRRDRVVDRAVAALYAARARHEALALNRAGQDEQAKAVLDVTARRIESVRGHRPRVARARPAAARRGRGVRRGDVGGGHEGAPLCRVLGDAEPGGRRQGGRRK